MKRITIVGSFTTQNGVADGQTVKTTILTEEMELALGKQNVKRIDTYRWKKNPLKLLYKCILGIYSSKNIMFLTDVGGIKIFPKLLLTANFRRKTKIHYYVVGGWLIEYLDSSRKASELIKKLDAIYVEIPRMYSDLKERGFTNVILVNKFRRIAPIEVDDISVTPFKPFKLCFFSRVMKEKGIEACIDAVKLANSRAGYTKYTLDIFGVISPEYVKEFEEIQQNLPDYIKYLGVLDFHTSSRVLKDYFAMLFLTFYDKEGYPNVFVDAYAAGLPIIATRWHYNCDFINDQKDGLLVNVNNVNEVVEGLEKMTSDLSLYLEMRKKCLARCEEYLPDRAVIKVVEQLD